MTHRISLGFAVCPVMRPKFCVPSLPSADVTRIFPRWQGAQRLLHHWGGGCRQGGDIPTAPLQKGKWLILPAGHTGVSVSTWRCLPKSHVLLPEEYGQPQRAAGTCGHLWTSLQEPHLPCILSDHTGSAPAVLVPCDSVTVGASLIITPVAVKGQGCVAINHAQEQPSHCGHEKLFHSQGCFPFISHTPQALKHRANIWQGRLKCWPVGWGPWWALDPCRGAVLSCTI